MTVAVVVAAAAAVRRWLSSSALDKTQRTFVPAETTTELKFEKETFTSKLGIVKKKKRITRAV